MKIGDYLDKELKGKKKTAEKDEKKSFSAVRRLAKALKIDESKFEEMLRDAVEEISE